MKKKRPYPDEWTPSKIGLIAMAISLFKTQSSYQTRIYDPEFHRMAALMVAIEPRTLNS